MCIPCLGGLGMACGWCYTFWKKFFKKWEIWLEVFQKNALFWKTFWKTFWKSAYARSLLSSHFFTRFYARDPVPWCFFPSLPYQTLFLFSSFLLMCKLTYNSIVPLDFKTMNGTFCCFWNRRTILSRISQSSSTQDPNLFDICFSAPCRWILTWRKTGNHRSSLISTPTSFRHTSPISTLATGIPVGSL